MAVDSVTSGSKTGGASETGTSSPSMRADQMGQDAFLKLLTVQLANQDPTSPQDNGEFIAQLATFSSLEQLTGINQKLTTLTELLTGTVPSGDSASEGK